jgi:serine/threonine protein kinase/tetratricopeptide (TPR) repeat protein
MGAFHHLPPPEDLPQNARHSYNPKRSRRTATQQRAPGFPQSFRLDLDPEPERRTMPSGGDPAALDTEGVRSRRTLPQGGTPEALEDAVEAQAGHCPVPDVRPECGGFLFRNVIGRGGFGEVWEAVQTSLGRLVAVKRMRPDLIEEEGATHSGIARLEQEFRQEAFTTALLEHPNIVPVYDVGTDVEGRSALAMKLVRGKPWETLILDELSTMPPLEFLARHIPILIQVSNAVAYGHSRGVVHRDLKPAQVMVGEYGEVILMDWGLAVLWAPDRMREAEPQVGDAYPAPTLDQAANPAGTPCYMAPEQTERTCENVGPWTDVFLLGAILYELLCGIPPYGGVSPREAYRAAQKGLVEPPEMRWPSRAIPRELSTLAMLAMRPKPEERIGSVHEFAESLKDYLTGAGRRREARAIVEDCAHRLARMDDGRTDNYGEMSDVLGLLGRAAVLDPDNPDVDALREVTSRRFAEAALANHDLVLARAHAERMAPGEIRDRIVAESHRLEDEERRMREERALAELFDRVNRLRKEENRVASELERLIPMPQTLFGGFAAAPEEPLQRASIETLLAEVARLRRERDELASLLPEDTLEAVPVALALAEANLEMARADEPADYARVYETYRAVHERQPTLAPALTGMGISAARAGKPAEAVRCLGQAVALLERQFGPTHRRVADALLLEAEACRNLDSRSGESHAFLKRSLAILEPQWADLSLRIADQHHELGDHAKAVAYAMPALRLRIALFGRNHPDTGAAHLAAARYLMTAGRVAEAELHAERATEVRSLAHGEEHADTLEARLELLRVVILQRRIDDAVALAERLVASMTERLGEHHWLTLRAREQAASAMRLAGDFKGAEEVTTRLVKVCAETLGEDHPSTANARSELSVVLAIQGRFAAAEENARRGHEATVRIYGPHHPASAGTAVNLAFVIDYQGRHREAAESFEEALRHTAGSMQLEAAFLRTYRMRNWVALGRHEEVLAEREPLARVIGEFLGEAHTLAAMLNACACEAAAALGRMDAAEESARATWRVARQMARGQFLWLFAAEALGTLFEAAGEHVHAADAWGMIAGQRHRVALPSQPFFAHAAARMALALHRAGHAEEALRWGAWAHRASASSPEVPARCVVQGWAPLLRNVFRNDTAASRLAAAAAEPGVLVPCASLRDSLGPVPAAADPPVWGAEDVDAAIARLEARLG